MQRITIYLSSEQAAELGRVAAAERRDVRDQAAIFVERGLAAAKRRQTVEAAVQKDGV